MVLTMFDVQWGWEYGEWRQRGGHASAERGRYDFAVPGARRDTDLVLNGGHVKLTMTLPSSSCF